MDRLERLGADAGLALVGDSALELFGQVGILRSIPIKLFLPRCFERLEYDGLAEQFRRCRRLHPSARLGRGFKVLPFPPAIRWPDSGHSTSSFALPVKSCLCADRARLGLYAEKQPVAEGDLTEFMRKHVRDTKKLLVLIDAAPDVEWNTIAAIMDAARGAGITKTLFLQPK